MTPASVPPAVSAYQASDRARVAITCSASNNHRVERAVRDELDDEARHAEVVAQLAVDALRVGLEAALGEIAPASAPSIVSAAHAR
jgi:hypothetical protein